LGRSATEKKPHVKYPLFLSDFNKIRIFSTDFLKILKFRENPSSGSRFVPCGQLDGRTDRQIGRSQQSLFAILQKRLRARHTVHAVFLPASYCFFAITNISLVLGFKPQIPATTKEVYYL